MAVFVCMPCSVKREIKQLLHIAVSDVEDLNKPNKDSVCQNFIKAENRSFSISYQKKEIQKSHTHYPLASQALHNIQHIDLPIEEHYFFAFVPMYILHQQYRI